MFERNYLGATRWWSAAQLFVTFVSIHCHVLLLVTFCVTNGAGDIILDRLRRPLGMLAGALGLDRFLNWLGARAGNVD